MSKTENNKENTNQQNLSEDGKMLIEGILSTINRYDNYRKDVIEKNTDPNKDDIVQTYKMYAMSTIHNEAPNLKNYLTAKSKATVIQYIDLISDDLEAALRDSNEDKISINRSRRIAKAAIMSDTKIPASLNEQDKAALTDAANKVGNHILGSVQKQLSQRPQEINVEAKANSYKKDVMERLSLDILNQEKDNLSEMLKSEKIKAHEAYPHRQNMIFSAIERAQNDFGDFLSKESKEELMKHLDLLQDQLKSSDTSRPNDKSVTKARLNIRTAIMTPPCPPYYLPDQERLALQEEAEKAATNIISVIKDNLSSKAIDNNIGKRLRDEMLDMGMEFNDQDFDKIKNYVSHLTKNLKPEQLAEFEETILDDMKTGIKNNQTLFSKIRHFFGDKKTEISDAKLIHVATNLKKKIHASIEKNPTFSENDERKTEIKKELIHEKQLQQHKIKHSENVEPKHITQNLQKKKNYTDIAINDKEANHSQSQELGK